MVLNLSILLILKVNGKPESIADPFDPDFYPINEREMERI
jgi:hypothetical protein